MKGGKGLNHYLARQAATQIECINQGILCGQQYAIDMMEIALHRQGWGYDRIKRLVDQVSEIADYYAPCMCPCMEQDVFQERLDAELRDIVKDRQEFATFAQRYPLVINAGYERMPKR